MTIRQEKVSEEIRRYAAEELLRSSSGGSLITITRAEISPDLKKGIIYITTIPKEKEQAALHFVERQLGDIRKVLAKKMKIKILPYLSVAIDIGEQNRQRIDELSIEAERLEK